MKGCERQRLEVGRSPAYCLISRVSFSSSLGHRVPKERVCHCLLSVLRVNNKQWKDSGVASSSPYCCHFGNSNTPPCSSQPPLTTHSLSTSLNLCHLPRSDPSPKPQRGGRPASPRCPLRNHERVWFRLEQGSHLFWAHLCWLTHVLTGKLAACSMGRGSTSPVGYQFLTPPTPHPNHPSFWAPCTSAHHKFKCTNSHPLPSYHPL